MSNESTYIKKYDYQITNFVQNFIIFLFKYSYAIISCKNHEFLENFMHFYFYNQEDSLNAPYDMN